MRRYDRYITNLLGIRYAPLHLKSLASERNDGNTKQDQPHCIHRYDTLPAIDSNMIQRKVGHKYVALLMVAFVLQLFLNHDLMKKMLGMGGSTSRESDSVNVAATTSTSTSTYMIAIADKSFQQRYDPIFNKMSTYASKYGYEWRVIGDTGTEPECEERFQVYFFRKHCIVAKWMQRETKPGDRVLVFDADVVPYRTHTALEHWLHLSSEDDLVFYDRTWNDEVMAGNYLVKNTKQGQNFLMGWAAWEDEAPSGFSSADNGAIHIHLLQVLGLHTFDKCRKKYKNLTALVTDLGEGAHLCHVFFFALNKLLISSFEPNVSLYRPVLVLREMYTRNYASWGVQKQEINYVSPNHGEGHSLGNGRSV